MSWTEFHPLIQEATLTTFAVGLLVLLVLVIRKPFAMRFGAKAAYLLWALPLARFVTPPLPGNWSLAGFLGFSRPAPHAEPLPAIEPIAENVFVSSRLAETIHESVIVAPHTETVAPVELTWTAPIEASEIGAALPPMPTIDEIRVTARASDPSPI